MMYDLYRWSIRHTEVGPYQPPELGIICLVGFKDSDPDSIRTSSIINVSGRKVTTFSGSVYLLQDMDAGFRDWLDENKIQFDSDNPIRIRK